MTKHEKKEKKEQNKLLKQKVKTDKKQTLLLKKQAQQEKRQARLDTINSAKALKRKQKELAVQERIKRKLLKKQKKNPDVIEAKKEKEKLDLLDKNTDIDKKDSVVTNTIKVTPKSGVPRVVKTAVNNFIGSKIGYLAEETDAAGNKKLTRVLTYTDSLKIYFVSLSFYTMVFYVIALVFIFSIIVLFSSLAQPKYKSYYVLVGPDQGISDGVNKVGISKYFDENVLKYFLVHAFLKKFRLVSPDISFMNSQLEDVYSLLVADSAAHENMNVYYNQLKEQMGGFKSMKFFRRFDSVRAYTAIQASNSNQYVRRIEFTENYYDTRDNLQRTALVIITVFLRRSGIVPDDIISNPFGFSIEDWTLEVQKSNINPSSE